MAHFLRRPHVAVPIVAVAAGLMGYKLGSGRSQPAGAQSMQVGATAVAPEKVTTHTPTVAARPPPVVPPSPLSTGDSVVHPRRGVPEVPLPSIEHLLKQLHAHPAVRWGVPSYTADIVVKDGIVVGYDRRMRNASWVCEHLTADGVESKGIDRKNLRFREETAIHPKFRALLTDYFRSGYDRGHLAPAADHRASLAAMAATFTLANVSPQVGKGFNRDYWARFERWTRQLTQVAKHVYVVTGPVWLPRTDDDGNLVVNYKCIGAYPGVAVPTHFFKAILVEMEDGRVATGAFMLPNAYIHPKKPLSHFRSTLDSVDRTAGLLLFQQLLAQSHETGRQPLNLGDLPEIDFVLEEPGWWKKRKGVAAGGSGSGAATGGKAVAAGASGAHLEESKGSDAGATPTLAPSDATSTAPSGPRETPAAPADPETKTEVKAAWPDHGRGSLTRETTSQVICVEVPSRL